MQSNADGTLHEDEYNWLVLALAMAAAAMIRQFFVVWHSGERAWSLLVGGTLVLFGLLFWLSPAMRAEPSVAPAATVSNADGATMPDGTASPAIVLPDAWGEHPDTAAIQPIIEKHCIACHAAQPKLMASAPKGATFDSPQRIEAYAALIHKQAVELKVMPPGNMTQMTDAERAAIGRWFASRSN